MIPVSSKPPNGGANSSDSSKQDASEVAAYAQAAEKLTNVLGSSQIASQRVVNAFKGALAGLLTGAAVGSVVPVIGTVIGGVVGAIVGTIGALIKGKTSHASPEEQTRIANAFKDSLRQGLFILHQQKLITREEIKQHFKQAVDVFSATIIRGWWVDRGHGWYVNWIAHLKTIPVPRIENDIELLVELVGGVAGFTARGVDAERFEDDFKNHWKHFVSLMGLQRFSDSLLYKIEARLNEIKTKYVNGKLAANGVQPQQAALFPVGLGLAAFLLSGIKLK